MGAEVKTLAKLATAAAVTASGAALVLGTAGTGQAADRGDLLVSSDSRKCLEIENSSKDNGALAQQWTCKGQAGSVWKFVKVTGSGAGAQYQIVNVNSGKCLEIADSRKDYGAPVQQWTCVKGVATQLWYEDNGYLINKNAWRTVGIPQLAGEQPNLQDGAKAVAGVGPSWNHWDPANPPAPAGLHRAR
ncbi:RICIN domain-containing protein [Streptomyces nondiastaticus]